jgi:hypothetical protein
MAGGATFADLLREAMTGGEIVEGEREVMASEN